MRQRNARTLLFVLVVLLGTAVAAQDYAVRINVARANVRRRPTIDSPVVARVTAGTRLVLKGIEGDWFRVLLPIEGANAPIEAFVSNTVAVIETADVSPPRAAGERAADPEPAPAPAADAPSADESSSDSGLSGSLRDGMAAAVQIGDVLGWLEPSPAALVRVGVDVPSFAELRRLFAGGLPAPPADDARAATYVWTIRPAGDLVLRDRRPAFATLFKDVPGVRPEDVVPMLLRLAPIGPDGRAVSAVRASAAQAASRELTWNVMRDLRQDVVRTTASSIDRGAVRLELPADLPPGTYAVVFRPRAGWPLAGASVLSSSGEGRLFSWAWPFTLKGVVQDAPAPPADDGQGAGAEARPRS